MRLKLDSSKLNSIILIFACILFALYGASNGASALGMIAILISLYLLFIGGEEENFIFLVAMIPFQDCWIVSGVSFRGIMLIIPILKLLMKRKIKANVACCFSIVFLLMIEVLNDFSHVDFSSFFNTICPLLYMGTFSMIIGNKTDNWNIEKITNIFIISSTIACLANLLVGGGLSAYNNDVAWYRFGQESTISLLPGAMEIPVFNIITIFVIIVRFLYGRIKNNFNKVFFGVILVAHFIFGIMTVSRVFIIGILVIMFMLFIWMIKYNKFGRIAKIMVVLGVLFIFFYIKEKDLIDLLFGKLIDRFSTAVETSENGRSFIWNDCISYLFSNPKSLLIGDGIQYYSVLGAEQGYAFSFMAHNFYLDVLMGVGFLGGIALTILFFSLISPKEKKNPLAFGILAIIMCVFIVSGTLNYIRNYIYIMLGIIFMNSFKNQIEHKNDIKEIEE